MGVPPCALLTPAFPQALFYGISVNTSAEQATPAEVECMLPILFTWTKTQRELFLCLLLRRTIS